MSWLACEMLRLSLDAFAASDAAAANAPDAAPERKKHKQPVAKLGEVKVTPDRLPVKVVKRILDQNKRRFAMCYDMALDRDPSLKGKVRLRFVIGRDGSVSNVAKGGEATLADEQAVKCVVSAHYGLSFPSPEGGIVTVLATLDFSTM